MRKRSVKLRLTMLLVTVCVLVLAACSGSSAPSATPAPASTPTPASAVTPEPTEEPEPEGWTMDFDLGGRHIVATAWWNIEFGDSPQHQEIKANIAELEERHNFTIEFVTTPYASMRELATSSVLAGEPFADIVRLERRAVFPGMVLAGLVTPLDEFIDLDGPIVDYLDPMLREQVGNYDGHLYGFEWSYTDFSGIYYNKTLLDDMGITDLHEYVENDDWTWENFLDVARRATQGDNYGVSGTPLAITSHAVVANGSDFMDLSTGTERISDPATLEAFTFVQELYQSGTGLLVDDVNAMKQAFTQGNVAMIVGYQWEGEAYVNDLGESMGFVPFPIGPSGDIYRSISNPPNFWTIPMGVDNPAELLYIMAKIWDVEPTEEYPGQTRLEKYFADENDIELARMMMSPSHYTVMNTDLFPDWSIYGLLDQLTKDMVAPATIVETNRQVLQAAMDDSLN